MSSPSSPPRNLGLRHVAINVRDVQKSKAFYIDILKMDLEWEPDPENVYLTSQGQDNLAIHRAPSSDISSSQLLDHIGFILKTMEDVDSWWNWITSHADIEIVRPIKTHRDGARSFYFKDPDGIIIQMIYHPPIAKTNA